MNKPLFIYKPDIEKMKKLNIDVAKKYPLLTYIKEKIKSNNNEKTFKN
jgi:hypothetical protein